MIKRILNGVASLAIICTIFKVAFNVDLLNLFILPLLESMINSLK